MWGLKAGHGLVTLPNLHLLPLLRHRSFDTPLKLPRGEIHPIVFIWQVILLCGAGTLPPPPHLHLLSARERAQLG